MKVRKMVGPLLIVGIIITIIIYKIIFGANKEIDRYYRAAYENKYIYHALGGIEGKTYLNTISALDQSYKKGARFFETDINFTKDKKLVLAHGWSKSDYIKKLGVHYNADHPIPTLEEFKKFKIKNVYEPASFKDLVAYMKKHKDMYVMIDIGKRNYEKTKSLYLEIVEECEKDNNILQRFITGSHTKEMVKAIQDSYKFKLNNLYFSEIANQENDFKTINDFIKYCQQNNITSFSTSSDQFSKAVAKEFCDSKLISYIFTVNDKTEAKQYFKFGATIVGTDFLYD